MKIRIERLELEVPDLVDKLVSMELNKDHNHNSFQRDLTQGFLNILAEYLQKVMKIGDVSAAQSQADIDELTGRAARVQIGRCSNCGGVLIPTGGHAVGLYKCVRCFVPAPDGEVAGGSGVDDEPQAGSGG